MTLIAPTILSADFAYLADEIKKMLPTTTLEDFFYTTKFHFNTYNGYFGSYIYKWSVYD